MCRDRSIDCHKLQTTRNGQPVSEWLVNEASLLRQIEENEIKWDEGEGVFPAASGSATRAFGNANPAPILFGNAIENSKIENDASTIGDAVAMPDKAGDAGGVTQIAKSVEDEGNAMATPNAVGDSHNTEHTVDREVGESRSLASVLIENAKLTAQLEGAHNLIAEVQDDRQFLRDELKEARSGRKDVTAIAERMLETLESIAIGGKLMPGSRNRQGREHHSEHRESKSDIIHSDTHDRFEATNADVATHPFRADRPEDNDRRPPWESAPDTSDPENPFRI